RTGRPLHHLHGGLDVVGVEVGHLGFGDLLHLRPGHRPHLVDVGLGRPLVDAGGLPGQGGRRRRLGLEGERPILVDRDLDRNDLAALVGRGIVVGLHEIHQVDAVRAEAGADGSRWRRLSGGQLQFEGGYESSTSHFPIRGQFLWMSSKPNSTGVSRPKMFTSTTTFCWSMLMSSMTPLKSANGPATTRTCSPTSHSGLKRGLTFSSSFCTPRNRSTSRRDSGVGFWLPPTNPVTPGVLRTAY